MGTTADCHLVGRAPPELAGRQWISSSVETLRRYPWGVKKRGQNCLTPRSVAMSALGRKRTLPTSATSLAASSRRHAFVRKFFDRRCVLREVREPHAPQHVRCLGELNIGVSDDLDAVAPRVEKVEKRSRQGLNACISQRPTYGFLVIDDQAEVAAI